MDIYKAPLLIALPLVASLACNAPTSDDLDSGGRVGAGSVGGSSNAGGTNGSSAGTGHTGSAGDNSTSNGGGVGAGDAGGHTSSSGGSAGRANGGAPSTGGNAGTHVAGSGSGGGAAGHGMSGSGADCKAPTEYPNLFVTLSGHTQADSDAKVAAAWNQLFNPSNNNTVYHDGPGSDESYVEDTGNNDVRTEGMSYGMMTAVQLDKQTQFDRLWAWVKNHMAQGTTGEIAWHCSTSGSKLSTGGAPDGEEYMATALIFANHRWGSTGKFDYGKEAQWVLDLIRTKYFNATAHIVKFVSGSNNTDGSYVLPAFYQTWACFDTTNADFWNASVKAGREFFAKAADSNGVIPDQSSFTGQSMGSAGSDAKRCVMNIMMDANFFAADPWQTNTYAPAFAAWMKSHSDNSAAQFSCNALLGFGVPDATGKPFVDKLWSAQIPTGTYRYYDGTLYMLGLLHVSGTFKLWF
ncbi:MAG TPA: glycosyl hydrolase family 8 [Polyangiaceae bacterium]|nr:glycosyl hydrolase family 8 [Polyangiaceae bacterium]